MTHDVTPMHPRPISPARLVLASLAYHWRMNLAVMLGAVAGTAVLTGALVVGDSVRGSLRSLTIERLGRIDEALVGSHLFREQLAEELAHEPGFHGPYVEAVPLMLMEGSVSNPTSGSRASQVTVLGIDMRFWVLDPRGPYTHPPEPGDVALNQPLADTLGVKVGDEVVVRLPTPTRISRDSPLGRKTTSDTIFKLRLRVSEILSLAGRGQFALRPNQQSPLNAYLNLGELQQGLDIGEKVNALLVTGTSADAATSAEDHAKLQAMLAPRLEDYGLSVTQEPGGYLNLTSERMLMEPAAEEAAMQAFAADKPQPVFTYLANYITAGENGAGKIPYSTIAAIDPVREPPLGPFTQTDGQTLGAIGDDEIVLNRWAFDDLASQGVTLKPGDPVTITYFEPESTHGQVREQPKKLRLKSVVDLAGAATDRALTPELKGVTDEESIANWDPPFPYDPKRVRSRPPHDEDERYWDEHKATPKAFVSLATGRRLWANRFGRTTSIRVPARDGLTTQDIRQQWQPDPVAMGFEFLPVKAQGLAASAGATPFNLLFLGFSMFIMAAAVMLVALLFRLGIEQRAREIGIQRAVGLPVRSVRRMLLGEGAIVALEGGLIGVLVGVGYAWVMLVGLRTWWIDAVNTTSLHLYVTADAMAIGYLSGVLVSLGAIAWSLWRLNRVSVRRLLSKETGELALPERPLGRWSRAIALGAIALAMVTGVSASQLGGMAQAGAFFGAGTLVLTAALAFVRWRLATGETGSLLVSGGLPLVRLALRNGARFPGRSTLTISLVAAATFLIVAISAFHLEPPDALQRRDTGTGGFALVARSDQPLYQDLSSPAGRAELGFVPSDDKLLAAASIFPCRLQPGDDASCRNLYQTRQPNVLGVPQSLIERGGFEWAATAAETPEERADPWRLLDKPIPTTDGKPVVPVVIDVATAIYSLHLSGRPGDRYTIDDGRGGRLTLQVVGLLANSIFQGMLLISERDFTASFPGASGYRFFLVETSAENLAAVETVLEKTLGDYGLDAVRAHDRLAEFLAVQNTYLATFQSLGGLGLLLGTFGVAVVQLRNVLERRGELALLRAAGFRRALLARLVMLENATLLVGGLVVGIVAAGVAILPHLLSGGATIPWLTLATTLGLVLVVGLLAGLLAVRVVLVTPLLAALREE